MLRKEQIEYALHYAEDPVEWVFELVRGLEKRIDELVKFGTKVTVFQEHWHPASELPPVNKNLISELVLCWCVDSTFGTLEPKLGRVWRGEWCFKDVKWWCYPPKED